MNKTLKNTTGKSQNQKQQLSQDKTQKETAKQSQKETIAKATQRKTEQKNQQNKSQQTLTNSQEIQKKDEQQKTTTIPRNVNAYSHFLKVDYITEQDIEWVLKLRNPDTELKEKLQRIPNQLFTFYDKKIKSQDNLHTAKDIWYRGNSNQVEHLLRKRLGPTACASYVQFETGLRDDSKKDKKLIELEKKWNNIPYKDKKEFPKFLPKLKEELQMRRTAKITGQKVNLYHNGFDRYLSLPKFNQKYKERNIANHIHLLTSDAFTSTVLWETSLRS